MLHFQIESFLIEKELILDCFFELAGQLEDKEIEEIDPLQREEVEKLRESLALKTKEVRFEILAQEVELVSATEKVRDRAFYLKWEIQIISVL